MKFRFKGLWWRGSANGQATRVSPGDPLWPRVTTNDDRELSARELAEHWTVKSVIGHISRGLAGCESGDEMTEGPGGGVPIRARGGDTCALLLQPHIRRIAKDVLRFGESILVLAEDDRGRVRELVPLRPDEVTREEDGSYRIGDTTYKPDKVLHIADELPAESPLESLRAILEEDMAATSWRKNAWKTAPRGLVERPDTAPEWNEDGERRWGESFLAQLMESATGRTGRFGPVPVLNEGMTWHDMPLPDAASAQFLEARRHVADAVATLYGVNGSLLATGEDRQLAPARKQLLNGPVRDLGDLIAQCAADQLAERLYGPLAANRRIAPRFDIESAVRREDEDSGLTKVAVGGPWRTPNEQRVLEGRERIDGADSLVQPQVRNVVTE